MRAWTGDLLRDDELDYFGFGIGKIRALPKDSGLFSPWPTHHST